MCRSLVTSSNIVRSDLPDVVIPGGQITSFIADKLGEYRGAVAMEDGITGNTITYDQLLDKVTTANNIHFTMNYASCVSSYLALQTRV